MGKKAKNILSIFVAATFCFGAADILFPWLDVFGFFVFGMIYGQVCKAIEVKYPVVKGVLYGKKAE